MISEPSYYVGRPVESMQTMLRFAAEGNNRLLPVVPDGVFGPADGLPHCIVTHDRRAVSSHMRFTALVIEDVSPPLPLVAVSYCWCMAYR